MEKRTLTCVVCPNGCELDITVDESKKVSVEGAKKDCARGLKWAEQEVISPERTIASNILVENGNWSLVSVRTDKTIPLEKITEAMDEIKKQKINAPIYVNDVIIKNVANTGASIIATRNVLKV